MFITVINDCKSYNEVGRQETRLMSLFDSPVSFVGVSSDFSVNSTLEAAGNLIDVLDAAEDRKGIVLLNVAPRGDVKQDGHNGTSFCYFRYQNVLVVSTVKGHSLSLVKKLGLAEVICLVDVEEVVETMAERGLIAGELASYITNTQFRSFDFVPRLAKWLWDEVEIPHTLQSIDSVETIPECIWLIDAFGNCKTTLLSDEVPVDPGETLETTIGSFTYYERLKDLPKGETAFYTGSSGIGGQRFVEIATQKQSGSAAATLELSLGDEVRFEQVD